MTLSVSSEFMALCQGQLRLLAGATGASLSTIYIAEEWLGGESSNLVPIAAYPESVGDTWRAQALRLMGEGAEASAGAMARTSWEDAAGGGIRSILPLPLPSKPKSELESGLGSEFESDWGEGYFHHLPEAGGEAEPSSGTTPGAIAPGRDRAAARREPSAEVEQQRLGGAAAPLDGADWGRRSASERTSPTALHQAVQPLLYDNRPVGILVVAREQEDWQASDYNQLEQVAQTLSAGCSMERRLQWLQGRIHQQEVAQERQQDILDNLAHQFRNPLTALRTFGKLLIRRLSPDDRNQAVAAGIVRESDRLQALLQQINQTVDEFPLLLEGEVWEAPAAEADPAKTKTSVAETPKLLPAAGSPLTGQPLRLGPCDVSALIQSYGATWEAIAQERGHELCLQIPADLPAAWGNAEALGEVLSNLLDNAFKYGAARGRVLLSVELGQPALLEEASAPAESAQPVPQGWQRIVVSNEGAGIPGADLAHLFERRFRGMQAEGDKPGTGLGLAIVKGLVEQMEGRIEIHSPAGAFHPQRLGVPQAEPPSGQPGTAVLVWLKTL